MQIDRSKFFALTTAISTAVIAAMGTATGCSSTATTTTDGGTTNTDGGSPGTDGSATDSGGDGSATDGGACLGSTGMATCTAEGVTPGPSCDVICSGALDNYTAGVAAEIAPCILALPTCEGGGADVVACHSKAIAKACADTTVDAYCTGLATTCGDAGTSDLVTKCKALAPALSTAGRTAFTSCVTESGCFQPIDTCIQLIEGG